MVWSRSFLLCIALTLLASCGGCVVLPTPYHTLNNQPDISDSVGNANSHRPLRVGISTKADVRAVLGKPLAESDDGRIDVYGQKLFSGYGVAAFPYPASGTLNQRTEFLRLGFDSGDVLRKFSVSFGDEASAGMGYSENEIPDRPTADLLQH